MSDLSKPRPASTRRGLDCCSPVGAAELARRIRGYWRSAMLALNGVDQLNGPRQWGSLLFCLVIGLSLQRAEGINQKKPAHLTLKSGYSRTRRHDRRSILMPF